MDDELSIDISCSGYPRKKMCRYYPNEYLKYGTLNFRRLQEIRKYDHSELDSEKMDYLKTKFQCFVSSFESRLPQLGRNHPNSDPESYIMYEKDGYKYSNCDMIPGLKPYYLELTTNSSFITERDNNSLYDSDRHFQCYKQLNDNEIQFLPELDEGNFLEIISELDENLMQDHDFEMLDFTHSYSLMKCEFKECNICLEKKLLCDRPCCQYPACFDCLQQYYTGKIEQGIVRIECCNSICHRYVQQEELSVTLDYKTRKIFGTLLKSIESNKFSKTCPRCYYVTRKKNNKIKKEKQIFKKKIICPNCELQWCFKCYAPWHSEMTCKQFQKEDRLLKQWAKEMNDGELNARRCPKCKIYIQKDGGCHQMKCIKCKTNFCYECGDKLRKLKYFGSHNSKFSIFGCKYLYKPNKPIQRKIIRGAIFGSKIMIASIFGLLAVGLGIFIVPVYGGLKYRHR